MFLFVCSLISCDFITFANPVEETPVSGKYFSLNEDKIDLFLPAYYKEYSPKEYKNNILKIEDERSRNMELSRFNRLKYAKGNVYFLKDLSQTTDVSIKMMDYFPFTKSDSAKLLGLLSTNCDKDAYSLNKTCTKLKAGYSGNAKTRVFMAKYKIESQFETYYSTFYAITSNNKSFIITFRSYNDVDYNQYIEKIKVK